MARKILIVEANQDDRLLLTQILGRDYNVIEAESCEEASFMLRNHFKSLSAVFLDWSLPNGDVGDLMQSVRGNAVWRQIPMIVTSEGRDTDVEEQAFALGANGFLAKPYRPAMVCNVLRNSISLRETATIINAIQRDKLTGLYNREAFFEAAAKLIKRHEPGYYVLSCFDIDSFKVVNDQYGIERGDEVLRYVADCLSQCVSGIEGLCCRFTADKFATLYPAKYLGSALIEETHRKTVSPQCIKRKIRIRIGRYSVVDLSLSVSAMFDRATLAQESIKGRYDLYIADYSEAMRKRLLHEQRIVAEMYDALKTGQFEPWFQPQYNHATGAMIGAEALVRWRHPKDGLLVPPGDFIGVFERNGFIYELDKYVWEQSCKLLRQWIDEGRTVAPIAVNISRYDVFHNSFISVITGLVKRYDIPIGLLHLEVTESAFAEATEQVAEKIKELIALGFAVAIDDFGSGFSSLNTLKDIPASILKLDMKFLESRDDSQRGGNILESIVRMAKWLGMSVVAEGVETLAQADYLKSIGCVYVQGYFYARPMPLKDFRDRMDAGAVESRENHLETVETLDNNAFWDPRSMDTLIFNSYVGGASIIEYHGGRTERIRANDRYFQEFAGKSIGGTPVSDIPPDKSLDNENLNILYGNIRQAIHTRRESTCEIQINSLDGETDNVLYLRDTVRVIAATDDRYLIYCVVTNITAQRLAEEQEHRLARQLQTIIDNMVSGVSAAAIEGDTSRFLLANERFYSQLGYTRQQFHNEVGSISRLVHPEDWQLILQSRDALFTAKQTVCLTYRVVRRDGVLRWLESHVSVVSFPDIKNPVQLTVTSDITVQKETDEHLRFLNAMAHELLGQPDADKGLNAALHKLLCFFDGKRAYIFEIDRQGDTASNTYEVCAQGVTREIDKLQRVPLAFMSFWMQALTQQSCCYIPDVDAMDDSRAEEREILRAQGIKTLVAIALKRDGKLIGFLGIDDGQRQQALSSDLIALGDYITVMLTRRDLNARILSDSDNVTRMMNDSPGGFHRLLVMPDGALRGVYANDGFCAMLGLTQEEVADYYREDALLCVHPDDRPSARAAVELMLRDEQTRELKYRLRRKDGDYLTVHAYGRVVADEAGNTCLNVFFTDHTAQAKLEEQQKALLDHLPCGAGICEVNDREARMVYLNKRYRDFFNREVGKQSAVSVFDVIHPEDRDLLREAMRPALTSGGEGDCVIRVSDGWGGYIPFRVLGAALEYQGRDNYIYVTLTKVES